MTSKKNFDISVIIPAYCAEKFIHRAVDSVLSQTILPNEIIIVDDGSTDNTLEIIESYSSQSRNVEVIVLSQENKGPGAARNLGLQRASSKYIAFLDSDDEWLPSKLEKSIPFLDEHKYDLVGHNVIMVEGKNERENNIAARYQQAADSLFFGLYCKGFIGTSTVVVSLSAIKQVGLFDENLAAGQDFDLWLKIIGNGNTKLIVFDDYLTKNHIRKSSITRNIGIRLQCTLRIARRHAPKIRMFGGSSLRGLIFRITAVHYEAYRGYLSSSELLMALSVVLKFPYTLLIETVCLIITITKEGIRKNSVKF